MFIVYVLKLERNKYYIGRTTNFLERLEQHIRGNGSEYTRRFKVIRVIEQIETKDPFDEDKITKKYMSRHGIDNVRGGSYTTFELDSNTKEFLQREIYAGLNKCYNCGKVGHYMRYCHQTCLFTIETKKETKKPILVNSSTQTMEMEVEVEKENDSEEEILLDKWKDLSKELINTTQKTFIKLEKTLFTSNLFKINMHNSNK